MPAIPETVLFLARSLERGGAERQLVVLAKGLARRGHAVGVVVFFGSGAYEAGLADAGVRVIDLHKRGRWDVLSFVSRLALLLRRERPAVLHSYLVVPNILAAALKPLLPGTRVVWGLRASNMDLSRYDWLHGFAGWLEARLARLPHLAIANSEAGRQHAVSLGFPSDRTIVIHNGIDTSHFRFDADGRRRVRAEWGVRDSENLIGLVARLDPMKDHSSFLQAASRLARTRADVRFVCVGDGTTSYVEALRRQSSALGLTALQIWAGARDDMPAVYSALDVATSCSIFGEGFSNATAEAMSCGVPCLVTDVGDSALIVGTMGATVPPGDPDAMARAIARLLDLSADERTLLGQTCRARIVAEFGDGRMIQRTEQALGLTQRAPAAVSAEIG